MSLLKRTSRAYVWGQAGRFAEVCLFFGFSLLLARVLGPRAYGIYSLGLSTAGLCAFVTLFGITPETLGKFVPESSATGGPGSVRLLLRKLLAVRGYAVLGAVVVGYVLSRLPFGQSHLQFLEGAVGCVLLVFAVRSFYDLLVGFSGALLELRHVVAAKILAGVTAPIVFLAFLITKHASVRDALIATAIGYLLGVAILFVPWLRPHDGLPPSYKQGAVPLRRILEFGFFAWTVNFFIFVLSDNTDVLLVGWVLGNATSVGYYAVGAKIVFRLVTLVLGWVPLIALASMSQAHIEGGAEKMAAVMQAQWKLSMLSLVGPLALLYCFAGPIVSVLFSPSYLPSVRVVRILCFLMIFSATCGFDLHSGVLYVLNRERLVSCIMGGAALFNILLEIHLVRKMGIDGAAWATGVSYLLLSITMTIVSAMFVPLRIPWLFNLKILAAASIAVVSTHWLNPDSLGQLVVACGSWAAAFLIGLALLKPLAVADSLHLSKISPRLGLLARRLFVHEAAGLEGGDFTW